MTNKQIIVMILAFTLVAVFCATGVYASSDNLTSFSYVTNGASYSNGVLNTTANGGRIGFNVSGLSNGHTYYLVGNIALTNPPTPSRSFTIMKGSQGASNTNADYLGTSSDSTITVPDTAGTIPIAIQFTFESQYNWINFVGNQYYGSLNLTDLVITDVNPFVSAFVQDMTVPAGYALRIYSSDSFTLQELVLSVPNSWNFPKDSLTSARYNGSRYSLYPDENIVQGASADSGSFVPWTALNANLFGRASAYSFSWEPSDYIVYPSYSYVITNPFYAGEAVQNESGGFHQNTEMIVTVYYSAADPVAFDLVPLRQSLSAQDGSFYYANAFDINSGVIHGTITPGEDEDPGTVDFGNPPIGGGNADQPPLSENTTIFGILSTLTNTITDLFNRAGDAMHSLVESCNSFFNACISFYGWLPAEWAAVLWSFFIILTVIGVVKLFL